MTVKNVLYSGDTPTDRESRIANRAMHYIELDPEYDKNADCVVIVYTRSNAYTGEGIHSAMGSMNHSSLQSIIIALRGGIEAARHTLMGYSEQN